jgi:S1-C subfamily serine protease
MTTTVTAFGRVQPKRRPHGVYRFAAFELADAPGPGFSGSPVLDRAGRVLGVSTQTRRGGELNREPSAASS